MIEPLFTGSAMCSVSPDGRMTLPPFARATLANRASSGRMLIGVHEADACLVAFDRGELGELQADCRRRRIAEEGSTPQQSYNRLRRIFGFMEEVEIGASGRIRIPSLLRRRAGIGDAVLVLGTGAAFELWNPQAALDAGDPDLCELVAFRLDLQQAA